MGERADGSVVLWVPQTSALTRGDLPVPIPDDALAGDYASVNAAIPPRELSQGRARVRAKLRGEYNSIASKPT